MITYVAAWAERHGSVGGSLGGDAVRAGKGHVGGDPQAESDALDRYGTHQDYQDAPSRLETAAEPRGGGLWFKLRDHSLSVIRTGRTER